MIATSNLQRFRWVHRAKPVLGPLFRFNRGKVAMHYLKRIHGITILAYHEVSPVKPHYMPESLWVSEARFEREMNWVKAHFNVISLETAFSQLASKTLAEHSMVITFDDGFSGVKAFAYPILKRLGIPATLFVNGAFVLGESLSPRIKIESLLGRLGVEGLNAKAQVQRTHSQWIKSIQENTPLGVKWIDSEYGKHVWSENEGIHLSLQDLSHMDSDWIHVANHGWCHRNMQGLSYEDQRREITQTEDALKSLPHWKSFFAAPFGHPQSVDDNTLRLIKEFAHGWGTMLGCGVNAVAGGYPGMVVRNAIDSLKPELMELLLLNHFAGRKGIPVRAL